MITHRASESVYCTTKRHQWFESIYSIYLFIKTRHTIQYKLTVEPNTQGTPDRFDSKIFDSASPFRIELDGRFEF